MSTQRTVAFLGPLGTFSHQVFAKLIWNVLEMPTKLQACIQMFGPDVELVPQATITSAA